MDSFVMLVLDTSISEHAPGNTRIQPTSL